MSNRTKARKGKYRQANAKSEGDQSSRTESNAPPIDGVEENLRTLFYALLNHFKDKVGPEFTMDQLHELVLGVLRKMNVGDASIGWEDAAPATITDCKRQANLHRALCVPATVAEIHDPVLMPVCGADGKVFEVAAISAKFMDRAGHCVWSLDITGDALIERVQAQSRRGGQAELLCLPVALPLALDRKRVAESLGTARRGFFLHLADLRASTSTLGLLGASAPEREWADSFLTMLASKGVRPGDALEDCLIECLNVVGLDTFPLLRQLLRFAVLQALSCGRIDHTPGRLHGMVIGPPGQGKKLVGLAARALNPVCEQISPTKVSPAGLVGASHHSDGRWVSQPGAFPRATDGVVVLQDAHGWSESTVKKLATILQEVMEDGEATDSVSGGVTRVAEPALLFDLNRTSQVRPHGVLVPPSMEAAILRVRPVLSRMDLLCDIPADVERAWKVARDLYSTMRTDHVPFDEQAWVRKSRLVVATLRDRHPVVDLAPVRALLEETFDKIHESNASLFNERPELGNLPSRMTYSFRRFASASARARDSSIATPEDVAVAASFITMKLEFHAMTGVSVSPVGAEKETPAQWAERYRGQEVATSDVKSAYEKATGRSADERTFRRALHKLGAERTGKGRYLLPQGR